MKIRYVVLNDSVSCADMARYIPLLPAERREKIGRYRFEKDKLLSIVAGLLIRRYTGEKPIAFGAHEKPFLSDNSLYFSVSHSGDIVAIALDETEVGMDVERLPDADRLRIADRFYHPDERDYVASAADPSRAFCRVWTRKEAYLKMTGEGISADLTAFDTAAPPLEDQLYTVDLDGYCLSVCSEKPIEESDLYISEIELKDLVAN